MTPDKPQETLRNTVENVVNVNNQVQSQQSNERSGLVGCSNITNSNRIQGEHNQETSRHSNLSNLFKAYSGNIDCYSGTTTGNLERKFAYFHEKCDQSDIFGEKRKKNFSIMLCSAANQYYFDDFQGKELSLE